MNQGDMSEPQIPDWNALEARVRQQLGQVLRVAWTLRRPPCLFDDTEVSEPVFGPTNHLDIEIQPELLTGDPVITLIAGNRRFRVIEET